MQILGEITFIKPKMTLKQQINDKKEKKKTYLVLV